MYTEWREQRILIWGKTYPELSTKYNETVCTGGTLENGDFIRLYPIPFRYLSDNVSFSKYQWIRARIRKSEEDPRPESYKIDPDSIVVEDKVASDNSEWFNRMQIISKNKFYHFNSVEELLEVNKNRKTSLGFVKPLKIHKIELEKRPVEDYRTFLRKFEESKEKSKQMELFGSLSVTEIKKLQFISERFKVQWTCNNPDCKGHNMSILDWEAYELARKIGFKETLEKLNEIFLSDEYNVGFFLGNFRMHQNAFTIGGIWYPKRSNIAPNLKLF